MRDATNMETLRASLNSSASSASLSSREIKQGTYAWKEYFDCCNCLNNRNNSGSSRQIRSGFDAAHEGDSAPNACTIVILYSTGSCDAASCYDYVDSELLLGWDCDAW